MADKTQEVLGKLQSHVDECAQGMVSGAAASAFIEKVDDLKNLFDREAMNTALVSQLTNGTTVGDLQAAQRQLDLVAALDRETHLRYARTRSSIITAASKLRSHAAAGGTIEVRMIRGCAK